MHQIVKIAQGPNNLHKQDFSLSLHETKSSHCEIFLSWGGGGGISWGVSQYLCIIIIFSLEIKESSFLPQPSRLLFCTNTQSDLSISVIEKRILLCLLRLKHLPNINRHVYDQGFFHLYCPILPDFQQGNTHVLQVVLSRKKKNCITCRISCAD